MKILNISAILVMIVLSLAACGGGGSSSGGGQAPTTTTLTGEFSTGINTGSVTIVINPDNTATVTLTNVTQNGVNCLPEPFMVQVASNTPSAISVGISPIPGVGGTTGGGVTTSIDISAPTDGSTGSIALAPPAPCFSSVGTVNLTVN